jgi:hypothetical protein
MGGTLTLGRKATVFQGLHEPDDARASRPESVSGWRCNSSGRLGNKGKFSAGIELRCVGTPRKIVEQEQMLFIERFS